MLIILALCSVMQKKSCLGICRQKGRHTLHLRKISGYTYVQNMIHNDIISLENAVHNMFVVYPIVIKDYSDTL